MGILKKLKLKWLWPLVILLVTGGIVFAGLSRGVEAEVTEVTRGNIFQTVEETGEVVAQNKQTVYIEGTGKVIDLKVDVGDKVQEGDLLLSLDQTELELQLKDAEAKLKAAQAQLAGTDIGNLSGEIELAQAKVKQAEIGYNSAKRDYEKAEQLFAAQAISEIEMEKAKDAYDLAKAALEEAKLALANLKQGTPAYLVNSYQAQVEQAKLQLDLIKSKLAKQSLRSPIDGIILERLVEQDTPVAAATPAFIIGSVQDLEIKAEILADEIHKIKIGNQVEIGAEALEDKVLLGKVTNIAPAAKTVISNLGVSQKRVPVTISFTDASGLLKPGLNVDLRIITGVEENVLLVPDGAVFDYQGKSQVFVMVNNKAVLREVEKGLDSDEFIAITKGLKEGETVLIEPDNSIREGIKIKAKRQNGSD